MAESVKFWRNLYFSVANCFSLPILLGMFVAGHGELNDYTENRNRGILIMNQDYYDNLLKYLNSNDHFCTHNDMRITSIFEGGAEAELVVSPYHYNGVGTIQGGALFTLADFVCAAAINSFGVQAVSMNASVSFIRPGVNMKKITARATLVNKGRTTAIFDVDVIGENGKILLRSMMTGHLSDRPMADLF